MSSRKASALLLLVLAMPAAAHACERQSVTRLRILSPQRNPQVAVKIDGTASRVYLDTGAERTILTQAAEERLGLPTDFLGFRPLWGIGGLSLHFNAWVDSLQFGDITLQARSVAVGTFGREWRTRSDGLLGVDVLGGYDADIDLPDGAVTLYRAVACDAPAPDWKFPATPVPLRPIGAFRHLAMLTVLLDGVPILAAIDTGAERSILSRAAAQRFAITDATLASDPATMMVGIGSRPERYRLHTFKALALGGETWRAPSVLVGDLPPLLGDMLLGVDFLRAHRIWISWINHTTFIAHAPDRGRIKQEARMADARQDARE
jgi:predicted aspartyl protease